TSFTAIPGISIKLSALDPRYEIRHWPECHKRLYPRLRALCEKASEAEIPITLDAEESHRLEMQLLLMSQLMGDIPFKTNYEMGVAIQAYQKRAIPAIDYLIRSAEKFGRTLHIRLVKGAYWDTEIKSAQQSGLAHYPVFINKRNTDLNYLLCAKKLLAHHDLIYPQFATHNPVSIAAVLEYTQATPAQTPTSRRFEFQKLYGMGDLFMQYLKTETPYPVRAYTPVGRYRELLPYLVRRLLENGVNSSILGAFHRGTINSQATSSSTVTVRHPLVLAQPKKVLDKPADLYKPYRKNSPGVNLSCLTTLNQAYEALNQTARHATTFQQPGLMATSILNGEDCHGPSSHVKYSPIDSSLKLGTCGTADIEIAETALSNAHNAYEDIRSSKLSTRCNLLSVFAEALHQHREELSHLAALETGKCIFDSLNEIREAIDFCYYYGQSAANVLVTHPLPHTAGEQNKLGFRGKGVVLCISPWNFPIAIFIGQIIAALVSGNAGIAKPASNAAFLAHRIIKILQGAGLPDHWVQLVLAPGNMIFDTVIPSPQVSAVAFTGSFDVAREINIALATRRDSLVPLIAETGGLNAMMVDSSALPEQVIQDTQHSAFNCAGQRCSALRILLVPQQQLKLYETTLIRAMDTLRVDSPLLTETDIGPVIDRDAFTSIQRYIRHDMFAYNVHQVELQKHSPNGHYIAPTLMMCPDLEEIHKEVFGPVLHLVPYDESKPETTIATLNKKGFSLTFGIHSRIKSRIRSVIAQINAGNIYVNRNIVGAVVGSQPFGGFGKSGTGTKAGGPHYLLHFVNEIAESVNINASGGDPGLFNQYE
ncbi:MAG: bifunctional proline dehydrogenase/L-glutamate gamma-semialdehyde dehydrogenase PutA, partial [Pseudomonadales bacterium]|nr:bifunctional proline dehydrogenase/L-glutamate gamma-semialdehyde dehydrogenase PutA [Pseudomonadales bacterium]